MTEYAPQAIINRPPAFFAARGLFFEQGTDDFGCYEATDLIIDGQHVMLMRYKGAPQEHTTIYISEETELRDRILIMSKLLTIFNLPTDALVWIRNDE